MPDLTPSTSSATPPTPTTELVITPEWLQELKKKIVGPIVTALINEVERSWKRISQLDTELHHVLEVMEQSVISLERELDMRAEREKTDNEVQRG